MPDENQAPLGQRSVAMAAGSTLVGATVAGVILDLQFSWTPWATLIGLGVGLVSCMSILIRMANQKSNNP